MKKMSVDINLDDIGSYMPAAGSKLPSKITTGYSRGPDIDSILKGIDYEDMLREVSKYPVCERRKLIRGWYRRNGRVRG